MYIHLTPLCHSTINYLDTTIEQADNTFECSILRELTTSSRTVRATPYHPLSQHVAAYNSSVRRRLNFSPSHANYVEEVSVIKHIALSNGYQGYMIDRMITKVKIIVIITKSGVITDRGLTHLGITHADDTTVVS